MKKSKKAEKQFRSDYHKEISAMPKFHEKLFGLETRDFLTAKEVVEYSAKVILGYQIFQNH